MSTYSSVLDWDTYFMAMAFTAAKKSEDPISKVGTCIVNENKVIVGIGFNQMPRGCNDKSLWAKDNDDPKKNKYLYVCHAAMIAITNKSVMDLKGCTMYTGLFPCNECAKLIIQNGIKEVVYFSDKYENEDYTAASKMLLEMAKVNTRQFIPTDPKITIDFSEIRVTSMPID